MRNLNKWHRECCLCSVHHDRPHQRVIRRWSSGRDVCACVTDIDKTLYGEKTPASNSEALTRTGSCILARIKINTQRLSTTQCFPRYFPTVVCREKSSLLPETSVWHLWDKDNRGKQTLVINNSHIHWMTYCGLSSDTWCPLVFSVWICSQTSVRSGEPVWERIPCRQVWPSFHLIKSFLTCF